MHHSKVNTHWTFKSKLYNINSHIGHESAVMFYIYGYFIDNKTIYFYREKLLTGNKN